MPRINDPNPSPARLAYILGADLKEARRARGVPRRLLAADLQVSQNSLWRWERGTRFPGPDDLVRIKRWLDSTPVPEHAQ